MSSIALRPRSGSEIVDAAVHLLRANYAALITIAAVVWLPVVLLELVFGQQLSDPGVMGVMFEHTGVYFLHTFTSSIALGIADAASIVVISDVYLGGAGSAGAALARVGPRLLTLIVASIIRNIVMAFGFMLLVLPGLYVLVRTFTLPAVVMCENEDAGTSYGRAWSLGEGHVGRIFLPVVITGFVYLALASALLFFALRLGIAVPVLRTSGVSLVLGNLGSVFFHPMVSVVMTLVYYDLRVRKEGFDLEIMAKELGAPAAA